MISIVRSGGFIVASYVTTEPPVKYAIRYTPVLLASGVNMLLVYLGP